MRNQGGFTLIEILVAMAIFAVIVIGALGVLGAADVGGFLEGFPTGVVTTRVARDTTAASVYLQAFEEFAATKDDATLVAGSYCDGPDCTGGSAIASSGLSGYPPPPAEIYQLDWRMLEVTIQRWHWDDTLDTDGAGPDKGKVYCIPAPPNCSATTDTEYLVRVNAKLTWRLRGVNRTLEVDRFMP